MGRRVTPRHERAQIVEKVARDQQRNTPVKITIELEATFDELRALRKYVDDYIADKFKRKWPFKTDAERVLLNAMESLAAALPGNPP